MNAYVEHGSRSGKETSAGDRRNKTLFQGRDCFEPLSVDGFLATRPELETCKLALCQPVCQCGTRDLEYIQKVCMRIQCKASYYIARFRCMCSLAAVDGPQGGRGRAAGRDRPELDRRGRRRRHRLWRPRQGRQQPGLPAGPRARCVAQAAGHRGESTAHQEYCKNLCTLLIGRRSAGARAPLPCGMRRRAACKRVQNSEKFSTKTLSLVCRHTFRRRRCTKTSVYSCMRSLRPCTMASSLVFRRRLCRRRGTGTPRCGTGRSGCSCSAAAAAAQRCTC